MAGVKKEFHVTRISFQKEFSVNKYFRTKRSLGASTKVVKPIASVAEVVVLCSGQNDR
jgi:hypothetical protein